MSSVYNCCLTQSGRITTQKWYLIHNRGKHLIKGLLSKLPGRALDGGNTLALTLEDNSLRYVLASNTSAQGATLVAWGTELRGSQTRVAFTKRVKSLLPSAKRSIAVLVPREYQILQIDSPNVPPEEMVSAVRWRAMEFVEGSPNDYTFDVLAVVAEAGRSENVIAVVAHNDIVRARMVDCVELGHPLSVIDVAETALRNLLHAQLLSEPDASDVAAALVADAGRALMIVTVKGELCFFRRFEFDSDIFAATVDHVQSALIGTNAGAEALARSLTQLHRSLDLWDDLYPQTPLVSLWVDAGRRTDAIIELLKIETRLDTRPFDLSPVFKLPIGKAPPPWKDAAYLPLLGALLRPKVKS